MPHKRKPEKEVQRQDSREIHRVAPVVLELLAVALRVKQQPEYDISADQRQEAFEFFDNVANRSA